MSDEALVGIPTAIDLTTGTRHHRDSIDQVPQPFNKAHLSCGECSTPVHAVRSSAQRRGDKLIARAAHFRLTNTLQAPHDPGCAYDWDAQTGQLVAQSMGSLVHDDAGFELQLPSNTEAVDHDATDKPTKHTTRPAAKRTTGGATLPVLLATAAKIAGLLHRLEDPDLAARFRASYNGTVIGWRDFYHDLIVEDSRETLTRFYDNLADEYPMAVAGVIHRIAQARNGQPFIDLHIERPAHNPERTAWIHVRIISYNLDFHDYQVGDAILAYGMWNTFLAPGSPNEWVSLWTEDPHAITHLTTAVHTPTPSTPHLVTTQLSTDTGGIGADEGADATSGDVTTTGGAVEQPVSPAAPTPPVMPQPAASEVGMEMLHLPEDLRQRLRRYSSDHNLSIGQIITTVMTIHLPE